MKKYITQAVNIKKLFSNPIQPHQLEAAHQAGMVAKKDLIDDAWYYGICRNASIARWNAEENKFYYLRTKFGTTQAESIRHPEDDNGYDLFIPIKQLR